MRKFILFLFVTSLISSVLAQQRNRPFLKNGTMVADNGSLLRGCVISTDYYHFDPSVIKEGTKEGIITASREYGMNAFHFYCGRKETPMGQYLPMADSLVKWTREAGVYLIFTIGSANTYDINKLREFWSFYAERYAEETHVIYEIQNEPQFSCNNPYNDATINMELEMYHLIKEKAPETPVILLTYAYVPREEEMLQDIQFLEDGGVDFSKNPIGYHGYYWCARARQHENPEYNIYTENVIMPSLIEKGYSFINTEFDVDSTLDGTLEYGGKLIEFYEKDRKTSWISFFSFPEPANDLFGSDFKNKVDAMGVSWCPDYGTWPENSASCDHGESYVITDSTFFDHYNGTDPNSVDFTWTASDASQSVSEDNGLTITNIGIQNSDVKLEFTSKTLDISHNPVIYFKGKSTADITLELQLIDPAGTTTSGEFTVDLFAGTDYAPYAVDVSGASVDITQVKAIALSRGNSTTISCDLEIEYLSIAVDELVNTKLTLNTSAGGSVLLSPEGNEYEKGTEVIATIVPYEGYQFDGWSGAAGGTSNSVTVTMTEDKTLNALFSKTGPDSENQRGRPHITGGTMVADNGSLLRGCFIQTDYYHTDPSSIKAGTKEGITKAANEYGMNAFHFYCGRTTTPNGQYQPLADSLVKWTREAGVYLVMTIGDANYYETDKVLNFWRFYASRYADETHVIYEIQNEPDFNCNDASSGATIDMELGAYNIIRDAAPETPVLLMSYSAVRPEQVILEDIQLLEEGGVDFTNAALAYHGYYWCARARKHENPNYAASTEKNILTSLVDQGYAFVNTEFHRDSTLSGTTEYGGKLIEFYENDRKTSWLSFFFFPSNDETHEGYLFNPAVNFKNEVENMDVSWCPDHGTWPQDASSCSKPPLYSLTTSVFPAGSGMVHKQPGLDLIEKDEAVQLTAIVENGYQFTGWSGDVPPGNETENPLNLTMSDKTNITANFELIYESKTFVQDDNYDMEVTYIKSSGMNSNYGSNIALILAGDHYALLGCDISAIPFGSIIQEVTPSFCAKNQTLYTGKSLNQNMRSVSQVFDEDIATYDNTISTIDLTGNGIIGNLSITAESTLSFIHRYIFESTLELVEHAQSALNGNQFFAVAVEYDSNKVFTYHSDDGTHPDIKPEVTIRYTSEPLYNLTGEPADAAEGSVSGSANYSPGKTAFLAANPEPHYRFVSWTGDVPPGSEILNPLPLIMDVDKSVTANFELLPQKTLAATALPTNGGTVQGAGDYDENSTAIVTAIKNSGYKFTNWTGDVPPGSENQQQVHIVMDNNKSVTANFMPVLVSSITIPEGDQYLEVGESIDLSVDITPGDALDQSVIWEVTSGTDFVTIDGNGLITAVSIGMATVTATASDGSGESASITVEVRNEIDHTDPVGTGVVTARAEIFIPQDEGLQDKEKAFDNLFEAGDQKIDWSKWLDDGGIPSVTSPSWIEIDLPNAVVVDKLTIISANDYDTRDPEDFLLKASNEASPDWSSATVLSSWTGEQFINRFEKRNFSFSNTVSFNKYRLEITKNAGNESYTQLCEIMLKGPATTTTSYTLTTYATNGDITLNPTGGTYNDGDIVTATATADPGYSFTGWSGASTVTTSPVDITMDADKSLTANFSANIISDTLNPIHDQYVRDTRPDKNFGERTDLQVKDDGSQNDWSYIKFDLSDYFSTGSVSSAKLRLFVKSYNSGATHNISLVNDNYWLESTITWNNRPTSIGNVVATNTVASRSWNEINLNADGIAALQNALGDSISFVIQTPSNVFDSYYSSESSYVPELIIDGSAIKSAKIKQSFVPEENRDHLVKIYPNPLTGHQLTIETINFNGNTYISIYSYSGSLVYTNSFEGELNLFNFEKYLQKGMYFIKISDGVNTVVNKLVVQ